VGGCVSFRGRAGGGGEGNSRTDPPRLGLFFEGRGSVERGEPDSHLMGLLGGEGALALGGGGWLAALDGVYRRGSAAVGREGRCGRGESGVFERVSHGGVAVVRAVGGGA